MNDIAPPRPSDLYCNIAHFGSDVLTGGAYVVAGYEIGVGSLPIISGVLWTVGRVLKVVDNTQCRFSGLLESVYGSLPELGLDLASIGLLAHQWRAQRQAQSTKLNTKSIHSLSQQIQTEEAKLPALKPQTSFSAATAAQRKAQKAAMAANNAVKETTRKAILETITGLKQAKTALEQAPVLAKAAARNAKLWTQGFSIVSEGAKIAIQEEVAQSNYLLTYGECKQFCDELGIPFGKEVPYETSVKAYDDLVKSKLNEFTESFLGKLQTLEDQIKSLDSSEVNDWPKASQKITPIPSGVESLKLFLEKPSKVYPDQNYISFLFMAKTHLKQNLNPSPTEGALYGVSAMRKIREIENVFDALLSSINFLATLSGPPNSVIDEHSNMSSFSRSEAILNKIEETKKIIDEFVSIVSL